MLRKSVVLAVGVVLWGSALASAQDSGKLALLIPGLFGPGRAEGGQPRRGCPTAARTRPTSTAPSRPSSRSSTSRWRASSPPIPLPTPASGFTYTFDSSLGVFQRSTQSFGPILTERAETIGRSKVTFGVTYQHFGFDSLEGVSLGSVPAVFTHDDAQLGGGRTDLVTTTNAIDASVDQTRRLPVYGLGSRLDLSVARPLRHRRPRRAVGGPGPAGGDGDEPRHALLRRRHRRLRHPQDLHELGPRQRDRRHRRPPQGQPRPQRLHRPRARHRRPHPHRRRGGLARPRAPSASSPSPSSRSPRDGWPPT